MINHGTVPMIDKKEKNMAAKKESTTKKEADVKTTAKKTSKKTAPEKVTVVSDKASIKDAEPEKKHKIENIALLLKAVLAAEGKVGLMLNVKKVDLDKIVGKLPALKHPTIAL